MKRAPWLALVSIIIASLLAIPPATAYGTTPYHFGFKKSKDGQLASIAQEGFMEILRKQGAIFLGIQIKKNCISPLITDMKTGIPPRFSMF